MASLPPIPSIPLGSGSGSGSGSTSASNSSPSSPQNTLDITSPTASPRYPIRSLGPHPPTSKTHGHPAFATLTHPLASFTIEFDDVNRRRGGAKPFRICFIVENMPHGGEPLECFIDAKVYAHKAFSNTYANYKRGRYGSTIVNEHIAFVVCGLVKNVEKDMVMMNMKNMKHHPSYALSVGAIYTVSFYCSPYLANCSVRYINTHSDYASLRIQVEQDVTHQNISQILSSAALIAANGQQPHDEHGHPHAMNVHQPNGVDFGGVPLAPSHPDPHAHDPSAYPPMSISMSHDPPMVKREPYDELGPPQPVPVKMVHTGFGGPQRIGAIMQQQHQGSFPRPFGAPPDIPGFTTPFQPGAYPSQSHISFPMVPPRTGASPISTSPSPQHAHFADNVLDLDMPQDIIMSANGHVKRRRSGQSTPSQPLSVPSYQPAAPFHPQTADPTYGLTRQFSNSMLPPGFLRTFSKPQPHKRNRRNSGPLPDPIPQPPSLATTMQQMTLVPPTQQTATTSSSLDLSRQTSFDVWLNQQGSSLLAAPTTTTSNIPSYPYYHPAGPNQLYPPGMTAPTTSTSTTSAASTSNSASQPIDLSREASLDVWRSIQNDLSHNMSNARPSNTSNPTPLGRMRSFSDPNLANTPFLQQAMMGYHAQYHHAMQQQQQQQQQQRSSQPQQQQHSQEERPSDVQFETYNLIDLSEMTSNTDTSIPQLNLSTQASLQFSISSSITGSGSGLTTQNSILPLEPSTSLMLSTASSLLLSTAPSLTTSLLNSSSSLLPSLSITNPDPSERSLYYDTETIVPASSESSLPTWQPSTTTQLNLEPGISL